MSELPTQQAPQEPAVSDGMRIGIAILSFFVPLVGIIMGIMFMTDDNPEKKAAGKLWLYVALGAMALNLVCCCGYMIMVGAMAGAA